MRVFFDTSVLVAAFLRQHPHHIPSAAVMNQAISGEAFISTHSMAEFFATVTRMPMPLRATPQQALQGIRSLLERVIPVGLTGKAYASTVATLAEQNMGGALIYDALILACAESADATAFYTWNVKHFTRFPQSRPLPILTPDHAA